MKKYALLLILIFFSTYISSLSLAQTEDQKIKVQSLDENLKLDTLPDSIYEKRYGLPEKPQNLNSIPTSKRVNEILKAANLSDETKAVDQLDKDILFRSARKYELEALSKHYPKIDKSKLKALIEKARDEKF